MILENRTRYRSADLEAVILGALAEAGLGRGGRDHVVVVYGSSFSGWCYKGRITRWNGCARMRLRLPRPGEAKDCRSCHGLGWFGDDDQPTIDRRGGRACLDCSGNAKIPPKPFDFPQFVWLVRHEVGHWRGLDHSQMGPSLLYWRRPEGRARLRSFVASGPVGSELPLPAWAADLDVAVEDAEPDLRKPRPTADATREEKLSHARVMLAKSERKAKTAATLVKRWRRRVSAAERAISAAASRNR